MSDEVRVGVDVGGTFTDLVAQPVDGGALRMRKLPSTADPSQAVLAGLQGLLAPGDEVVSLTHGTTVATNAMLEGRVARTALITTQGFRDVLEIGRQQRDHLYRLDVPGRAAPLVPRTLRYTVSERMDHTGRVLIPLDEAGVHAVARAMRGAHVEAVAGCLLHAYANPAHERRVGTILSSVIPHVCLSSDVNAEFREYERTQTTCANAALMPLVDRYLANLAAGLAAGNLRAPVRLMQSSGGMATTAWARRVPVAMLMSGPAAGVAAARGAAAHTGAADAVTLDMGGTSTDVCLIRGARVETVSERRLSGQPVRFRSLAVESIGAGGGSVAWRDRGGALRVGPRSAGAMPGPACYGRGGGDATVTDACLVLGYIGPEAAFGGLQLDAGRAWRAVESLGAQFGLAAPEAAAGIVEIANAAMARAVRTVSVQRGHDVRQCCLIAYGGAGPIHAGRLAQTLDMPCVLVPPHSSAFSAYGCLAADLRYDAVRTVRLQLLRTEPAIWEGVFREVEIELLTQLEQEGVPPEDIEVHRSMDLRYIGQNYEIEVPVTRGEAGDAIRRRFVEAHRRRYDYATDEAVEGVNLRVAAIVPTPPPAFPTNSRPPQEARGARQAYFYGSGRVSVGVYSTGEIVAGRGGVIGPAILEDTWSTIVVYPGQRVRCDRPGYAWIEPV